MGEHYHFVTGRLAAASVQSIVSQLAAQHAFSYSIQVMPITVAALMTGRWVMRHLQIPDNTQKLFLPGYLAADIDMIRQSVQASSPNLMVECGPKSILDLPELWKKDNSPLLDYGKQTIQIVAEINHADQLDLDELVNQGQLLTQDGADIIDLGCTPGKTWVAVAEAVQALKALGLRVSIDSFDPGEVSAACQAGAELVLSVNSQNCDLAAEWGCEVVAIPDTPEDLPSLFRTAEKLDQLGVPHRLDPILQPLCLGLSQSLERYAICRREHPEAAMMMGIGNLTELTDVDSAGVNVMLMGICQELGIQSVLTTQVINWARSSVRECDRARRLVHYAARQQVPPKHIDPELVLLRDPKLRRLTAQSVAEIGAAIKDSNFRLFIAEGKIHAVTRGVHATGNDPFEVMQSILDGPAGEHIDASHAFYLGFEMCKALQALILSKNYEQDEPLRWGYLTRPERHWRLRAPRKPPFGNEP